MKRSLAIALLFLFIPAAFAKLEVNDIRGYVNNERAFDVDESGGDFDTVRGDTLDLVVRLRNPSNSTVQAKMIGTMQDIDNNEDIIKTQGYYDIEANTDRSKTLTFVIPENTRRDEYNMILEILNGTGDQLAKIDYNVIVDAASSSSTQASITEVLSNLTISCKAITESTNTCFGYISKANNCSSELSTVKEERGTFEQSAMDCAATKAEMERKNT